MLDEARRRLEKPLKLVVSGPASAGKTTLIQSISETKVVSTDEWASEDLGKDETTVAFDFGSLTLGETPVYLFGTPGQDRFDYMWEVLSEGADGLLLLVAGDMPDDLAHAKRILHHITKHAAVPFLVGVTRQDRTGSMSTEQVAEVMGLRRAQVVTVNAKSPTSALLAATVLLGPLIQGYGDALEPLRRHILRSAA